MSLLSALARRSSAVTTRRSVQTVPRAGPIEQMEADAVAQLRARLAYQKDLMAENPHKSHSEEWTELWTWIKISFFVCGPVVVLSIAKDLAFEEHAHRPHGPLPEYMGVRVKEFPWECDQCDIFDLDCWKKCRAEKAGN